MNYFLVAILSLAVTMLPFIFYIVFACKNSTGLSLTEMRQCEKEIKKHYQNLIEIGDYKKIAEKLKLEVKCVEASDIEGFDSRLCPSNNQNYYGTIQFVKQQGEGQENFRCYHEIVHYIRDVGLCQPVRKCYGKNRTGETKSHDEQIVNYLAAAIAIPQDRLKDDLFGNSSLNEDELINELSQKYKQPATAVKRRIKEVKMLNGIS